MDRVYLDNAATTRPDPRVLEVAQRWWEGDFGNPSSVHPRGQAARRAVDEARRRVADSLGADPAGVVFTSGATEANNLAFLGGARARRARGRHVLIGATEHTSVRACCSVLEGEGFTVETVPVDGRGRASVEDLGPLLRSDTVLVALMLVNNELGSIHPVRELAALVADRSPHAAIHCDGVQALGKIAVDFASLGVASMSFAGHKIHGPPGIGLLVLDPDARPPEPLCFGGGQEGGLRPGTENVASVCAMAEAVAIAVEDRKADAARMGGLRARLADGILERLPEAARNDDPAAGSPAIVSFNFAGTLGEPLVHHLAAEGVDVATGSACRTKKGKESPVLRAIGVGEKRDGGTLRLSMGRFSAEADIDRALEALPGAVEAVRKAGV